MSTWADRTHSWDEWADTWANDVLGGVNHSLGCSVAGACTVDATPRVGAAVSSVCTGVGSLTANLTNPSDTWALRGVLSGSATLTANGKVDQVATLELSVSIECSATLEGILSPQVMHLKCQIGGQAFIADVTNLGGRAGHKAYSEVLL